MTETTRRGYLKLGVGLTAASAGVSSMSAPASAGTGVLVGFQAADYLIRDVKSHFSNLGTNEDYADANAESLYVQSYIDANLINTNNESVLTTVSNLTQNAKSVAYQQARAAYLESLNNGDSIATAEQDAIKSIEDYIAPSQANIIERRSVAISQIEKTFDRATAFDNVSGSDIYGLNRTDGSSGGIEEFRTKEVPLVDGSVVTEVYPVTTINGDLWASTITSSGVDFRASLFHGGVPNDENRNYRTVIPRAAFAEVNSTLINICEEAKSELRTFSSGIADSYTAGDISTEDLTTPRDLWAMSSEDTENPYAAADLAGLGLEVNQDSSVTIELIDDAERMSGSIYLSKSPIGESLTVGSVYDPTQSVETDANGDPIAYEGTQTDPIPLDGLCYIAYNTSEGSTYGQLKQPFEVVQAAGPDGQTLSSVNYQPSVGQQTTTTDIEELRSEMQSMTEEIKRLEEEKQEAAGSGDGGGGVDLSGIAFGGIPGEVVGLGAATLGAYLLGR